MAQFISVLFNGVSLSSIILLTSLGLAITFGLMRVVNMAHGEFVMLGAYMTYLTQQVFRKAAPQAMGDAYIFVALIVAFAASFALGCILEKLVVSRLYGRVADSLLATVGVSLILQQAARSVFGAQGVNVTAPTFMRGGLSVGGATFSYIRLFIFALVVVTLAGMWFVINRTKFGAQMRAVMQNREMAQCMGINSRRIDNVTFGIGSGIAGVAGCSIALLGSIDSTVGQNYIVNSFVAVVLGGVGKLLGTIIGSGIVGVASIGAETFVSSSIAKAIVLFIIIVFLQRKPQGLFTIRSRGLDE
ncbi:MAG: urea ABC transporter permease subunit UrtB, partial [Oscillospiraceae bacterium]|nr:urea ABC transporter permease subunit UrtB [Oscillospiraceae bacterium]